MTQRFRKKPVVIEAVRYDGTTTSAAAIRVWISGGQYAKPAVSTSDLTAMRIETLEGGMAANPGDWIAKGVVGEFYPVKPDVFALTYEPISDEKPS